MTNTDTLTETMRAAIGPLLNEFGERQWQSGRGVAHKSLEEAFEAIIDFINTANEAGTSSAATSGSSVSRSDVGQYVAEYDPKKGWSGTIKAYKVKADGTAEAEGAPWDAAGTAKKLDDLSNAAIASRVVLSWGDATAVNRGVPFKWASASE